ncbi:Quinic acid utilization activator [Diplodia seriata]|uniref:Quinic acid utilization activator n=1 Tax=Diplodia seriata TaxID=420778 RepID=A0A1S8B386_9PEZI|nr:Quinic acid utilization activator [Diplodia seriata]
MAGTEGGEKAKRKVPNPAAASQSTADAQQHGNPAPAKRQRVSRACDQCRTAREKCDGIQPSCFTCASSNRDCTYTANPKKRGIQPGYIRTLELALAWTFANVPASEDALLNLLVQPEGRALLSGKDQDGSYKLHRKWRKSAFCRDIDRVLSGADPVAFGEKPASPTSPDDDALDDADGASVIAATPVGPSSTGALPHRRPSVAGGSESSVHRRLEPTQSPAALSANQPLASVNRPPVPLRPKLKVPSNLWRLFDVYFAYTHCWFPIAEKHDVLKISYSYPEDGLDMSANSPGSGEHAELWSILAVASVQENAANPSSAQQSEDGAKLLPGDIYNIARSLIPSEQGSHELGHVKALLLLALVNIGANMSRAAWFLIGYAARLAFVLGLHNAFQPQGRFHGNEDQSPRGKHVFLACFALDTIVSAHLGREPFMRRDHVDRVGLIAEDGLEEWHPWVGCPDFKPSSSNPAQYNRSPVHTISTFNHIIRLLSIVNDVSVGVLDGHSVSMHLQQWITSLPPTFKSVQSSQLPPAPTPTLFSLRLIYLWTTMAFAVPSVVPPEMVAESFLRFADAFGTPALLPIFSPLIALAGRSGAFEALTPDTRTRWTTLLTCYRDLWRKRETTKDASPLGRTPHSGIMDSFMLGQTSSSNPAGGIASRSPAYPSPISQYPPSAPAAFSPPPFNMNKSMHEATGNPNFQQPFGNLTQQMSTATNQAVEQPTHRLSFSQALATPITSANKEPTDQRPTVKNPSISSQTPNSAIYDGPSLERYPSAGSNDLDALFDELATLEGPERLDSQPQFMQNLGFAPDMNLSDVLSSDYGQFDPMFNAYLQHSVAATPIPGQPGGGQTQGMEGRDFDAG